MSCLMSVSNKWMCTEVELRFFVGLSYDEIADVLEICRETVKTGLGVNQDLAAPDAWRRIPWQLSGSIRRLGDGGMGVVYLAVQESLGRKVALKVNRRERMGSFEVAKRFWCDVAAVSELRHPNIVTVHGSGEEEEVRFFAMELVPGRGLNDVLAEAASRKERIQSPKILGWVKDIARALDCACVGLDHRHRRTADRAPLQFSSGAVTVPLTANGAVTVLLKE